MRSSRRTSKGSPASLLCSTRNLPEVVGPVRSARIGDLDLLSAMNRPVFAYSGANPGVTDWISSAAILGRARRLHRAAQSLLLPHGRSTRPAQPVARPELRRRSARLPQVRPARCGRSIRHGPPPAAAGAAADTTSRWRWMALSSTGRGTARPERTCDPRTASHTSPCPARRSRHATSSRSPRCTSRRPSTPGHRPRSVSVPEQRSCTETAQAIPAIWSRPTAYDPFEFVDAATGQPIPLNTGTTFIELVRAP